VLSELADRSGVGLLSPGREAPKLHVLDHTFAQNAHGRPPMETIMRGDKTSNRFDTNQYLTVLQALRLDKGLVLDWVYWNFGLGGVPVFFSTTGFTNQNKRRIHG